MKDQIMGKTKLPQYAELPWLKPNLLPNGFDPFLFSLRSKARLMVGNR